MSTSRDARDRNGPDITAPKFCHVRGYRKIFFLFLFVSLSFQTSFSEATETVVVRVTLNYEEKGEFFVELTEDGDFLMREDDLRAMGFETVEGMRTSREGGTYFSLGSMEMVDFIFDEHDLALAISASPSLLGTSVMDFGDRRREDVYYPRHTSAFFNYEAIYSDSNTPDSDSFGMTNELGIRARGVLFLTDASYRKTASEEKFVRLLSSVTYDWRRDMRRLVGGDFFASSGVLGSRVILGGASFSRVYNIDPYFQETPLLDFSGFVSLPSEAEVYVNGNRVLAKGLSPGRFELRNVSTYSGAGEVEVVLRDPFGEVRRLVYPFYYSTRLMGSGLHEYSYGAGFVREDFGVESDRYGELAVSAHHRYGLRDSLTLGYRAEGGGDVYNLGPETAFLLGNAGVVTLSVSASLDDRSSGEWGSAGLLRYEFVGRNLNTRFDLTGFTEEYATLEEALREPVEAAAAERTKYAIGAGVGFHGERSGSVAVNYSGVKTFSGQDFETFGISYAKTLFGRTKFTSRLTRVEEEDDAEYRFFFGITHNFKRDVAIAADFSKAEDVYTQRLQVRNTIPLGEGLGYRVSAERHEDGSETTYALNPFVQVNTRYGTYRGNYRREFPDDGRSFYSYYVSASGGVGFVGDAVGLSRPIRDSFGLVKVGDVPGVAVYVNNQEAGRTDSSGRVFVPELSSYVENQVSIGDTDIPIDYTMPEVSRHVSPPLRSGSVIDFRVERFQAVTGLLKVEAGGKLMPVEYVDVNIIVGARELTFVTGRGGEIYVEDLPEGSHVASFVHDGMGCSFDLIVPESDETLIDLGELVCSVEPAAGAADVPRVEEESAPIAGAAPPEEEIVYRVFGDYAAFEGTVYFPFNSDVPFQHNGGVIERIFRLLDYNRVLRAEIEGHADSLESTDLGRELGMLRARVVKSRLVALGLQAEKITNLVSYGEKRPLCTLEDEMCRRKNRRASVRLVLRESGLSGGPDNDGEQGVRR
jgi:outer membrane usher protein FimD/PapC